MGFTQRFIPSPTLLVPTVVNSGENKIGILPKASQNSNCGILDQMTFLFSYATNIFESLAQEASQTGERIKALTQRVEVASAYLPTIESEMGIIPTASVLAKPTESFALPTEEQQQIFVRENTPNHVHQSWERCVPPPNFSLVDEYADDGLPCLRKYTNPNFFIEHWAQEMERKHIEARQKKKEKKRNRAQKKGNNLQEKKVVKQIQLKRKQINALGAEFSSSSSSSSSSAASPANTAPPAAVATVATSVENVAPNNNPPPAASVTIADDKKKKKDDKDDKKKKKDDKKDDKKKDEKKDEKKEDKKPSKRRLSISLGRSSPLKNEQSITAPPPDRPAPEPPKAQPASSGTAPALSPLNFPPPPVHLAPSPGTPITPSTPILSPPAPPAPAPAPAPPPPPSNFLMPSAPPPPSLGAAAPSTATKTGGTGSLTDQLNKGVQLKAAAPVEKPAEARSGLMDSIKQGIHLKKVVQQEKKVTNDQSGGFNVAMILARRNAIEESDSDDDDDEDDSGWDD